MKRYLSVLFALLMVAGLATAAGAALTFDVDFWTDGSNPVNNYAQGGAGSGDLGGIFALLPGEQINVDIYFSTDLAIIAGSWDLQYSPFALASVEGTTPPGSPWGFGPLWDISPGSVKFQDGVAVLGSSVTGNNILFGSVLFQCQDPGDVDLLLAVDSSIGGFLTAADVIPFDNVNLGTLNQVPIPGAIWLLGTGLLGLVGMRRNRRK
jgi:hypothetical protein